MNAKNNRTLSRFPNKVKSVIVSHRGIIPPIMTVFILLLLLVYVVLTYGHLGLVLWELAPLVALFLVIPLVLLVIWSIYSLRQVSRPKPWFSIIVIMILLIFQFWSFIPCLMSQSFSNEYEQEFKNVFGPDYFSSIPLSIREQLASVPFSLTKLLFLQTPSDYQVERNIPYGNHSKQVLDIYLPGHPVMNPYPAVLLIHGESTWEGANKAGTPEINSAGYFTAQGLAVVSIEYRLPEDGMFWDKILDIRSAIAWIRVQAANYSIDPELLFVLGRSRGGHLATTAVYSGVNNNTDYQLNAGNFTASELSVAGLIDLYGAVNPYMAEEWGTEFLKTRNEIFIGCTRDENPDLYRNASAAYLVSPDCPPTLIMHGTLDGLVSPKSSRHLAKVLAEQNVTSMYLELPTGEHQFDVLPWTAGGQIMYYFAERFIWTIINNR